MERTKRQRFDTIHDYTDNKKRKLENRNTITKINTNKSLFEDLANEILYEIFEFLDIYHIYQAFFNLNKRFQYFLINSTLPIKINISTMSKSNFEHYHNDIIIPNKHRIHILRLSNPFTVDIIFSPPRFILKFLQLDTLILDHIKSKYLENILNHLLFLPNLHSLTIHPIDYIQNLTLFYIQIFRLPKLKFCQITYETNKDHKERLLISADEFSPIERLIINARFSFDTIDNLLSYVPRLRRLSINSLVESCNGKRDLCPITLKDLEYVSLKIGSIYFNQFEILIKYLFQHIQRLRISTNIDKEFLNAKRWEQLILNYMPNLRIFDFNHDGIIHISYIHNPLTFHQLINQFNSSFWIERKWFFTHQHTCQETLNSGIFYSIEPYSRKEYKFYWELNEQVCLYGEKTNLDSVKHVEICSKQVTNNCLNYFPNATELTIRHNFNTLQNSMATALNRIVPLIKLGKLFIEYYSFPFEQLLKFLYFTPNLHTLKFGSISFYQSNLMLIPQNDTFQYVSKMNQIKNFDLHENCTLECIQMIIYLFPRLEYFKTGLNKKEMEQIARFLFSKINKKTYLFFLCISYTPKIYLKKLKILIKLENLLDDYFIDLVNYDLYLWW